MEKKNKRKKGTRRKTIVAGGVLGVIVYFLMTGSFSFDFFTGGESLETSPAQVEQAIETETPEDPNAKIIVEVIGNKIFINDKEVEMTNLIHDLNGVKEVVFKIDDAKQIMYVEVKELLQANNIIVIEEQ